MNIKLNAYELMTVTLPDGQTVEIDARNKWETDIYVNNRHGDCYKSLIVEQWQDDQPDPSLSAAERNPNLR
tara:strand:+ start:1136 stop:1348 length:213 start_codon:yes stop_codon:yes gene_type:complete